MKSPLARRVALVYLAFISYANTATAALEWEPFQDLTAGRHAKRWAEFGRAVAVDGSTLVVGSYGESSDSEEESGFVFVFEKQDEDGEWIQTQTLQASDAGPLDYFGDAVALQNDTLVVGAWGRDGYKGRVYIFHRRSDGRWIETQKLVSTNPEIYADYGRALAIDSDTLVVGEPWSNGNNNNLFMGAAYVYRRHGRSSNATFALEAELVASYGETDNNGFGWDVDVSGNTIIVGAPPYPDAGYAVVFERNLENNSFDLGFKLKASDGSDNDDFGRSVQVQEDTVVVSSRDACYVFKRSRDELGGSIWQEEQKLATGGYFVALDGNNLLYDRTFYRRNGANAKFKQLDVLGSGETSSVALSSSTAVIGDRMSNGYTGKSYVFVSSDNPAYKGPSSTSSGSKKENGKIILWSILGALIGLLLLAVCLRCCCLIADKQEESTWCDYCHSVTIMKPNSCYELDCQRKHHICAKCFGQQMACNGCEARIQCVACGEMISNYTVHYYKREEDGSYTAESETYEIAPVDEKLDPVRYHMLFRDKEEAPAAVSVVSQTAIVPRLQQSDE